MRRKDGKGLEKLGLVDTSYVIAFLRDSSPTGDHFETLLRNDLVVFSAISVFELRLGEATHQSPSLEVLFESVRIVPFDQDTATRASTIYRKLEDEGQRIGLRDTFIAATAMMEGLPLYTLNQSHFERIDDLDVLPN